MEGIGSSRGFLGVGTGCFTDVDEWLCCMKSASGTLFATDTPSMDCNCTDVDFADFNLTCNVIASLENQANKKQLVQLYPNPSSGVMQLEGQTNEVLHVEVYSATGNLVYQQKNTTEKTINLSPSQQGCLLGENDTS